MKFIEIEYFTQGQNGYKVNKIVPVENIKEVIKIGNEYTLTVFSYAHQVDVDYKITEKEYLYLKNALCDVVVAKFQPREA